VEELDPMDEMVSMEYKELKEKMVITERRETKDTPVAKAKKVLKDGEEFEVYQVHMEQLDHQGILE
jgi:hypothetical protein